MNPDILKKIKKCLALAKSSNVNEAATALRQAQALMKQHNINSDDVAISDVKECDINTKNTKQKPGYEQTLAIKCAQAFECDVVLKDVISKDFEITLNYQFFGLGSNAELAAYAFSVLNRQLQTARRSYMASTLSRYNPSYKTKHANSYCYGWVRTATQSISNAITPENKARLDAYKSKTFGKLQDTPPPRDVKQPFSAGAFMTGLADGKNAQYHVGMGAGEQQKRLG